ncbi:MAG: LacI family DNA-binding transcriptional regulator [Tessaracoccus sp.]|uniref:LacI family DNA-binding transcriptional regulator n=1 Tax=Tessaracoccus sp. TaxID=1971211 RepID=UPI001ECCA774|nr:LacI family DNA-binding transcriptional regulator [Tessaracoccus sp.]MBK7822311.1 LacI family DNA-binding transcriptional regulator [Tessaracoccus sp.]
MSTTSDSPRGGTGAEPENATLKDVAKRAGVSIKTASRVLNDHPSVAPTTRKAVLEAMEVLDYLPDPAAQSLRGGTDRSVGVLVDSIGDVFFAELAASIEAELDAHGYRSMIVSSNRDPQRERDAVNMFVQRRCAGMIVAPLGRDSLSTARLRGTPLVFVDRIGEVAGAQSVVVDDRGLSAQATEHLIAHGHRRIAVLSDRPLLETTQNRHHGYRDAMNRHGLPVDEDLIAADVPEPSDVVPAVERLLALSEPPTAILSTNSRLSLALLPTLQQFGRTDIAILAYGDFTLAGSLSPAVSVIDHSPAAIGAAAVAALLPRLDGKGTAGSGESVIYVPAGLIARGSGELRPRSA